MRTSRSPGAIDGALRGELDPRSIRASTEAARRESVPGAGVQRDDDAASAASIAIDAGHARRRRDATDAAIVVDRWTLAGSLAIRPDRTDPDPWD